MNETSKREMDEKWPLEKKSNEKGKNRYDVSKAKISKQTRLIRDFYLFVFCKLCPIVTGTQGSLYLRATGNSQCGCVCVTYVSANGLC